MKKFTFIIIVFTSILSAKGQDAFMRRDLLVNAGIGIFNYRHINYNLSERAGRSIPVFMSGEYGITPFVSVGIFGGYRSMQYRYKDTLVTDKMGSDVYKSRFISAGLKGTVHFTPWLEQKTGKDYQSYYLDLYSSLLLGYEYNILARADDFNLKQKSRPVVGLVAGARYYFNHRFAVFGEVGPGIYGIVNVGATARF